MEERMCARLARLIGYPTAVPGDAVEFRLVVDGHEVQLWEGDDGSLTASQVLCYLSELPCEEGEVLRPLSAYAFGRTFRERAVLAHDPDDGSLVLWQRLEGGLADGELVGQFEAYLSSCDWWRSRVSELTEARPSFPEMVFRP